MSEPLMSRQERTKAILQHVIPYIKAHREQGTRLPFVIGLTGLQGSGKSTLASDFVQNLRSIHNFRAVEVSLDDFYKTHAERQAFIVTQPENEFLKIRGQPGTHDTALANWFFNSASGGGLLGNSRKITLPVFDKSLFAGAGDRLPEKEWRQFDREPMIDVLVFEGWCLGFRPLADLQVEERLQEACNMQRLKENEIFQAPKAGFESRFSTTTLAKHSLRDLLFVNERLREYCDQFMGPQHFDFLVHLDSTELVNVYKWRMEQESKLRDTERSGMSDEQVINFIQGYMPAYELYLDDLREGFFKSTSTASPKIGAEVDKVQLHVILDINRQIIAIDRI